MTDEQVEQTLRSIVVEAELEVPVGLCSSGRAAMKQFLFIREERGFNVTGVGGDGFCSFGSYLGSSANLAILASSECGA